MMPFGKFWQLAEISGLSQVTEVVAGFEKPLVKKAKIHFFFEPYGQLSIIRAEFYLVRSILSLKFCSEFDKNLIAEEQ